MNDTTLEHDGLKFRCRIDGPEGAPWMVFSNSLATDLTLWDDVAAAFAGRYRTFRYDQRGHGGTDVPDGPASIPQLAADARALMMQAGVAEAVFVGVSMGAATGLCLAAQADSPISRLVAADGNAATPPGGAAAWAGRLDHAEAHGMAAFADLTIPRWFTPESVAEGIAAIAKVRAMIVSTPLRGLAACVAALQDYDVGAGLGDIRQPALLLAGSHDGVLPQTMRALQARIAGATFTEIAGAGHLPCIEQPAAFIAAIEAFLA